MAANSGDIQYLKSGNNFINLSFKKGIVCVCIRNVKMFYSCEDFLNLPASESLNIYQFFLSLDSHNRDDYYNFISRVKDCQAYHKNNCTKNEVSDCDVYNYIATSIEKIGVNLPKLHRVEDKVPYPSRDSLPELFPEPDRVEPTIEIDSSSFPFVIEEANEEANEYLFDVWNNFDGNDEYHHDGGIYLYVVRRCNIETIIADVLRAVNHLDGILRFHFERVGDDYDFHFSLVSKKFVERNLILKKNQEIYSKACQLWETKNNLNTRKINLNNEIIVNFINDNLKLWGEVKRHLEYNHIKILEECASETLAISE